MKRVRYSRVKQAACNTLKAVGFATGLSVLTTSLLIPSVARAENVPRVCKQYDSKKLLSNYEKLPKKERIKPKTGAKLLKQLRCIQETRGLPSEPTIFSPLLRWAAKDEQNALETMRLARDVVTKSMMEKPIWGKPGQLSGPDLERSLWMTLRYWTRSASISKIIDAYMGTGRNPGPATKKDQLEKADLLADLGTPKDVPGAIKTLIAATKSRKKADRENAASKLYNLSYSAMNWLDDIPESEHPGGLLGKYGFKIMVLGCGERAIKADVTQERAIAKTVLSACMRSSVARRIQANLDGPEAHDMRLIRKVVRKERLLK